ncbi:MAG: hypothetical protein M5U19_15870 [Microthrixaceae bacterium]|nr:hypothetical protein [Microthrixaceae bacterium]
MSEVAGTTASQVVAGRWPREVLVVRGPDAIDYLHGQVSADVVTLEPGQSTLALLLDPKGRLSVLVRLWRTDEQIVLIDTDAGAGDAAEARLRRFLLRTNLTIDRLDWDCVIVRGPGASDFADRAEATGAQLVGLGMWPGVDGLDLLGPRLTLPEGIPEAAPGELEALRIRSGWPAHGAEVGPGVIPAEVGPWLITAAVSFTKGCYVGQELTTRIHSRGGNVPRNLRSFEVPAGRDVSVGDDIVVIDEGGEPGEDGRSDDGAVGMVTSAAVDPRSGATVALGYVKRSVGEGARLGVP